MKYWRIYPACIVLLSQSICNPVSISKVFKTVLEACKSEEVELPILEVREVKKVSLVVITGDRGLCGGYNSAIIKSTTKRIAKLDSQGIKVRIRFM